MLADSYYCSFFLTAALQARGVDILFEQHGARQMDFRTGEKLGARDHVVQWSKPVARPAWMRPEEYAAYPTELTLREMKVRNKILVTSFLNPREVCKRELGYLFMRRWNVELDLRNIKSTLGMERLTCKTPEMCEKEVWVAWSQRQFLSTAPEDMAALFRLIAHVRVGNRPGRMEPRLVKTRPKPFGRLQTTRRRARANIRKYGRPKKLTA